MAETFSRLMYETASSQHQIEENELMFGPHDFAITHYEDTTLIVGHQPTRFITGATPDEIFHTNDTIALDCGLGFGGKLGVLCLDTMEELYF